MENTREISKENTRKPLVFVCSPYRGDVEVNAQNARKYCRLVYEQGGIPFAPHLLFTQFLNDDQADERDAGLQMGLDMLELCDELWAFGPPSTGMAGEIGAAIRLEKPVRCFDSDGDEVGCNG